MWADDELQLRLRLLLYVRIKGNREEECLYRSESLRVECRLVDCVRLPQVSHILPETDRLCGAFESCHTNVLSNEMLLSYVRTRLLLYFLQNSGQNGRVLVAHSLEKSCRLH